MKPNFCIITTTYKRPDTVLRSVSSVRNQLYSNWQHIVVIDDPNSDYSELRTLAEESSKLHLIENSVNVGKNSSVNSALDYLDLESFNGYIIFLDDDDWLTPNCLADFATSISNTPHPWLVSERAISNTSESLTVNRTGKDLISYQYNNLIRKDFSGDTTHCIDFPSTKSIRFPFNIKNAEEWVYFAHISTIHPKFIFLPAVGTLSDGYAPGGLTDVYHKNKERRQNFTALVQEVYQRKIFSPLILVYLFSRLLLLVF